MELSPSTTNKQIMSFPANQQAFFECRQPNVNDAASYVSEDDTHVGSGGPRRYDDDVDNGGSILASTEWIAVEFTDIVASLCSRQIHYLCFSERGATPCCDSRCDKIHLYECSDLRTQLCGFFHENNGYGCLNQNCEYVHLTVKDVVERGCVGQKRLFDFEPAEIHALVGKGRVAAKRIERMRAIGNKKFKFY